MTEIQSSDSQSPTEGVIGSEQRSFGRVYVPNPGSINYPLRSLIGKRGASTWKSKIWRMGRGLRWRSQGGTPHCVRYGNTHNLMIEPIIRADAFDLTAGLYQWAQDNDEWPGNDYDGTSVDAGLRFLKNIVNLVSEYRWARNMDDVLTRLSITAKEGGGPLVLGTDFYAGMDRNGPEGERNVWEPTGSLLGGHCYNATGQLAPTAKRPRQIVGGNSHLGNFEWTMSADAFEWLIFSQNGEAAAVTEIPKARRVA